MKLTSRTLLLAASASLALYLQGLPAAAQAGWTQAFEAPSAQYSTAPDVVKLAPGAFTPKVVTGTVRYTLFLSAGGDSLRVRFTNETGTQPMHIAAATVGLAGSTENTLAGKATKLTFGGQDGLLIPPGAPALSDPVELATKAYQKLVVSVYAPEGISFTAFGSGGMQAAAGNQVNAGALTDTTYVMGRPFISGVSVHSAKSLPVIVAFGDSITDGVRGKVDILHGWPEELGRRLSAVPPDQQRSVVSAGISGNRVLSDFLGKNALARLDTDAFSMDGVRYLILLEGVNDIGSAGKTGFGAGPAVQAEDLIAAYKQIVARSHERGIKVIGGTIMPFARSMYKGDEKNEIREAVNNWIRTSGAFDGIIDFDAITRDPAAPTMLRGDIDSGDHLHPSEKGYRAIGDAIDLTIFK